jgi:hypothetical protein
MYTDFIPRLIGEWGEKDADESKLQPVLEKEK